MKSGTQALSLAEVILSVAILALALLAMLNLIGSALRSSSRTENLAIAGDVAEQQLTRNIYAAINDLPAGSSKKFWDQDYTDLAWRQGSQQVNHMDFHYAIYAQTLTDAQTGKPAGNFNRLKKVDIVVWWMHSSSQGGRQGYGQLRTGATRLVNELAPPP
ncbi:MAG: hypothetical protein U0931_02530 [Vulcanimicrobiota bacterium]